MKKFSFYIRHPLYFPMGLFLVLGIILIFYTTPKDSDLISLPEPMASADTLIPYGYVLVPIELVNESTLHSILGHFGIVDLFLPAQPGQQGRQVADDVKIIRAPRNPSQFAVLVQEKNSRELVKMGGPFIAVIQNPSKKEGEVLSPKDTQNRISYGH